MKYLALIPNYYGFGKSAAEAKKALRRAVGEESPVKSDIALYEVSDDYWIDAFGTAHGAQPARHLSGPDYRN